MCPGIEIDCSLSDEVVEIVYGDTATGKTTRIVTIAGLFLRGRCLFIDGLCHLRGEDRSFALDRIHFIRELTRDGAYASVTAWMGSYGVSLHVGQIGSRITYILDSRGTARNKR